MFHTLGERAGCQIPRKDTHTVHHFGLHCQIWELGPGRIYAPNSSSAMKLTPNFFPVTITERSINNHCVVGVVQRCFNLLSEWQSFNISLFIQERSN